LLKKLAAVAMVCASVLGGAAWSAPLLEAGSSDAVKSLNRRAAAKSLVLPGWGQWSKGYRQRGVAIGVVEAGLLAAYVQTGQKAGDARNEFRRGQGPYSRYTKKVDLQNFILIMAGAVWGYNVIDAYIGEPASNVLFTLEDKDTVRLAYRVRY
jgi:hypothetical protein